MAHRQDEFVGIRVPKEVKKHWAELARAERRSLSNWILYHLDAVAGTKPEQPTQYAPSLKETA